LAGKSTEEVLSFQPSKLYVSAHIRRWELTSRSCGFSEGTHFTSHALPHWHKCLTGVKMLHFLLQEDPPSVFFKWSQRV
jgi:hypothetical protein